MRTVKDEVFEELKREAIKIWQTYDDTYGYATEKITCLNSFGNVKDNYGTIIGMFDAPNQRRLFSAVGVDAKIAIADWTGMA